MARTVPRRSTRAPSHPAPTPLRLLEAELTWAKARVLRIARQALGRGEPGRYQSPLIERRLEDLVADEHRTRAAADALKAKWSGPSPLDQLAARFQLNEVERTAVLLAAGVSISRELAEAIGELPNTHAGDPTVDAIFRFCGLSLEEQIQARRSFRPTAPLTATDLVDLSFGRRYTQPSQLLESTVAITGRGLELVLGSDELADELLAFSNLEAPLATFAEVVLPERDRSRILQVIEHAEALGAAWTRWRVHDHVRSGRGQLFLFTGPPGTGKTSTAHAIAHHLGRRVLNVDIPTFVGHSDAARFLPGLFREARLHNALLFFDECEALFASRRVGNDLMTVLLTELDRFEGMAVLATNLPDRLDEALDRRVQVRVDFPNPDALARAEIWRLHIPSQAETAGDIDPSALGRRFEMTGGYIKNAVLNAIAAAVHEDPAQPVLRQRHLEAAARDQQRRPAAAPVDGLAEPRAQLRDLILPRRDLDLIEQIVAAASARGVVFDRWGVGAHQAGGRGIVALFSGPPGTGKTLAAEAIAGELARPLLRITPANVLSRWVGDAERALTARFRDAEAADAVLLIDEADGLLATRGAGQHHDDRLVITLLDLIDRHEGVVILCTNRRAVLDAALRRRVGWSLRFEAPGPEARAALWAAMVPAAATGGVPLDLRRLAADLPLTGGQVRSAAVRAATRAATAGRFVSAADLRRAAEEELDDTGDSPRSPAPAAPVAGEA
jgi:SpoVK/Ycf46/Vps4 family AAA+-type ATPase